MFTIRIIRYYWSCGDGCCSDSGLKLDIFQNKKLIFSCDDWDFHRDESSRIEQGIKEITELLGRTPVHGVDYSIQKKEEEHE